MGELDIGDSPEDLSKDMWASDSPKQEVGKTVIINLLNAYSGTIYVWYILLVRLFICLSICSNYVCCRRAIWSVLSASSGTNIFNNTVSRIKAPSELFFLMCLQLSSCPKSTDYISELD